MFLRCGNWKFSSFVRCQLVHFFADSMESYYLFLPVQSKIRMAA
jgi:hypothetical protein